MQNNIKRAALSLAACGLFSIGAAGVAQAVKNGSAAAEAPAYVILLGSLAATFGAAAVASATETA